MKKQWQVIRMALMLVSLSFGISSFLLPIYSKTLGMSAVEIGGMFSVFSLVLLVVKPIMGKLADKVGWKWFLVGAMLWYAVAFGVLAYASSAGVLYVGRMIQAVGAAFLGIATYTMSVTLSDGHSVGQQLGQVTGAQSTGIIIGSVVSFFVLGYTNFLQGWYRLFMLFAVMAGLGALLVALNVKESVGITRSKEKLGWREKYSLQVMRLLAITFLVSLSASMLSPILMVYLQDRFITNLMWLGIAFMPSCVTYSLLGGRLGHLGDRYGYVRMMLVGILINCIVAFMIPSIGSIMVLGILWCIDAVGDLIEGTSRSAFLSKVIAPEVKGEIYGLLSGAGSLGAMIGPLLGGMLYDKVSVRSPFYMNGIGLLIVGVLILVALKEKNCDIMKTNN